MFIGTTVEATLNAQYPAPPCESTVTGTLEAVPLDSKVYANKRFFRAWLPPGYLEQRSATRRYPVLSLFDGQDLFDLCTTRSGQDDWHVDEIVIDLIA